MNITKMVSGIDTHTAGEAARLITGGIPKIPGKTMAEKRQYLIENKDELRKTLMFEPRGHNEMFGAFIVEATVDEADFGIIFMDSGGYLNMCGHNTIAAVTAAVETGMVDVENGATEKQVVLETPAGLVTATAYLDVNCSVSSVSFDNVESFLYKEDQSVEVEGIGKVKLDIAFGGSFFAILPASEVGLNIEMNQAHRFSELGMRIRDAVNAQISIQHPKLAHIRTVDLVEFYGEPSHPDANAKNVVVFGNGQLDRSPCGTGTSAKLAVLHAKGELNRQEPFIYESILGTLFKGEIIKETELSGYQAVIPQITGSAFITGFNTFLVVPEDPLKHGFVLNG